MLALITVSFSSSSSSDESESPHRTAPDGSEGDILILLCSIIVFLFFCTQVVGVLDRDGDVVMS